jgi:hypothetical protein
VSGLEYDLGSREPELRQTGRSVHLIATAVTRLLARRAVIAEPVCLDHQSKLGPEEVDLEPVHQASGRRLWQAGPLDQR